MSDQPVAPIEPELNVEQTVRLLQAVFSPEQVEPLAEAGSIQPVIAQEVDYWIVGTSELSFPVFDGEFEWVTGAPEAD
ncbi:MAG: hypothetical protein IPO08_22745 [Xanthomonadales bacterium]|nr:hypothetical protein [Xanthomonadales bacterium]